MLDISCDDAATTCAGWLPFLPCFVPLRTPTDCDRCGCGRLDHRRDDCGDIYCTGCAHCSGYRPIPDPEHAELSTSASCADICTCGAEHAEGAVYYVSAVRGATSNAGHRMPGVALLLGPYSNHAVALGNVDIARDLANEVSPMEAPWLGYGTLALRPGAELSCGVLEAIWTQKMQAQDEAAAAAVAEPTQRRPRASRTRKQKKVEGR
jgi:hypothetical protein